MNRPRPFVVLPFPRRGQEFVSDDETTPSTNGRAERAGTRLAAKREKYESAARFFRDINGLVQTARHNAAQCVACASGRGVPADQMVR